MDDRAKIWFPALAAGALMLAGCGYQQQQQSRFQLSFLPSTPSVSVADIPPPTVTPNFYRTKLPSVLTAEPQPPRRRTAGDEMVDRAEKTFQHGKSLYQAGDIPAARRQFDAAIDLMIDAAAGNPEDRVEYEELLEGMVERIHRYDLAGMGASDSFDQGKFEKAPLEDLLQMTFPVDPKLKDRVREQVTATVSQLPLSVNDAVLGYINYFANRGRKTIIVGIQRSGRYRPMIQRILEEEGIPQELLHLAQAESGFIPRAVSNKAAGGMWQFLTWRGQQYGLMQTRYTDDRMDPEMATRAAARHLHDLYTEFGDWYLAMAAYNCGPGAVERAVERTGYADFWELRNRGALPLETTNYVPIVLAMTIMEKNAAEYGLEGIALDPPLQYDTLELPTATSLSLISDVTETPLSELAALNPALLRGVLPAKFPLRVPKGMGSELVASLEMVPAEHRDAWRMHRVAAGETLASIGRKYGVGANAIVTANHLPSADALGDRLVIPAVTRADVGSRRASAKPVSRQVRARGNAKSKPAAKASIASAPRRKPPVMVARNTSR